MNNLPWCSVIQKPWSVIYLSKIPVDFNSHFSYYIWVDKSLSEMPKMVDLGEFLKNLKLAVKQFYQTGHF